jgi:undecaprenyl pyrophosphate synthase
VTEFIESASITFAEYAGMDYQVLFNLAITGFGFLAGVLITNIWKEIKQLQANEKETTKRIGEIEVLVAGEYTTKTEFVRVMDKVFDKLDDINNKLTHKADR